MLMKSNKVFLLLSLAIFIFTLGWIQMSLSSLHKTQGAGSICIWDPLHHLLAPLSKKLRSSDFFTNLLLALDSLLIDVTIVYLGLSWAFHGRTKSFIPSLLLFYITRALILNIGKWPLPRLYLFGNPGVPSFFVDYDKTNDLFFSGHCGGLTVMLADSYFNGRQRLAIFLSVLLVYTFFVLAVLGGHYTNDMIIGSLVGFTIARLYFNVKEVAALWYMKTWGSLTEVICCCSESWKYKKVKVGDMEVAVADSSIHRIRPQNSSEIHMKDDWAEGKTA